MSYIPNGGDSVNPSRETIPPRLIGGLARQFIGEPNKGLSTETELRFGTRGSLSVDLTKGTFYDFEAGEGGGILAFIERETGAKDGERWKKLEEITGFKRERRAKPRGDNIIARYDYRERDSAIRYQIRRLETPPGEPNRFQQARPDPDKPGGWLTKKGCMKGIERLPYRLPELLMAIERGDTINIPEGEKDVQSFVRFGLAGTTNSGGGGNWQPELAQWFKGANVVLWCDNDEKGRAHIDSVGAALTGTAASIRFVDIAKVWPDCLPKGDVSDWIKAGAVLEDMLTAIEEAPEWTPPEPTAAGAAAAEIESSEKQGPFLLVRRQQSGELSPGVYHVEMVKKKNDKNDKNEGDDKDEYEEKIDWVCSLLEPLAETRDRDNRNWGKQLEVIDGDGVRHVCVMPAKMGPNVGDGAQFRSELVDRGLKIAPGPKARSRLSDYVTVWRPSRKVRCVTRTGWSGDAFVLPDKAYGGIEEIVAQIDGTPPKYATAGSLQGWRDEIAAKCAGNSRLVFGVSTAFSGPILKIANESSGGSHFLGGSSKGKTTILHVARSVWGRELGTWRGTDNAAEAAAAGACDTLLVLDEIGQAAARVVGEMIYMLGNERGKQRMKRDGGLRQTYEWRLPFLSTGEVSIATKLAEAGIKARAGQEVRLIEVKADAGNGFGVFEDLHGFKGGAELADYLKAAADRNCGHPGRELLARITAEMDTLPKTISEARARFIAKHCPKGADGQVQRVCGRLAIVGIAGELATRAGITGWRQGEAIDAAARIFKDWLEERGGAGAAELRRAFEQVRLFLEQHGEARFTPAWEPSRMYVGPNGEDTPVTSRPTINRAGFRKSTEEGTTFYVLREIWRDDVCKGIEAKAVATAMIERGWMVPGDGRNLTQKLRIPGHGPDRVYVIPPEFLGVDT